MKSLFTAIYDGLTFKDIAGKRHPRTYVVLTTVILILLATLASCVALEHKTMMAEVQGTPVPVSVTLEPSVSPEPTQVARESCSSNPADWTFLDVTPDDNFKRIEPACVYEGLGKSVAWALAVRSGYARAEAAQALHFTDFPMRRQNKVMALTNTEGPFALEVSFTPPHPDFAEWRVDESGNPALAYALRGCFRTSEIVGNQEKSWNAEYPVICVLSEDSAASRVVMALDGHIYTAEAGPTRSFALFGYGGDGRWLWLGAQKEPKIGLDTIPNYLNEARGSADLYGLPILDASWMGDKYGLLIKPLPKGWQSMTDETDKQAILNGLNEFLNKEQP